MRQGRDFFFKSITALFVEHSIPKREAVMVTGRNHFTTYMLDDQPRQYWIYANTDNELTVHRKVE